MFRCHTIHFMAYLMAIENVTQKDQKASTVTFVIHCRHFVFLLKQFFWWRYDVEHLTKWSENWQYSGGIAHSDGVIRDVIKSMELYWPWSWSGWMCTVGSFGSSWLWLEASSWRKHDGTKIIALRSVHTEKIGMNTLSGLVWCIFCFFCEWWHDSVQNHCFFHVTCGRSWPM